MDRMKNIHTTTYNNEQIEDPHSSIEENRLFHRMTLERVLCHIDRLDTRRADIIRMRFGLDGTKTPKTLKEIGTKINLTKERVRQIEKEALSELRQRILGSTQSSPTHSRPQHYTQLEISAA
jgi:RNA polymerase sigma factor (sigma-70 family)